MKKPKRVDPRHAVFLQHDFFFCSTTAQWDVSRWVTVSYDEAHVAGAVL